MISSPAPSRSALVGVVVVLLAAGCAASTRSTAPSTIPSAPVEKFGHVHEIDLDPADGSIWAATHMGVFRLDPDGPHRTFDRFQDTMGFTIAGPDRFLASGHPDPRDGGPDRLGLIESLDRAVTWTILSLRNTVDFHALSSSGSTVYGLDATTGRMLRSDDGGHGWSWLTPVLAASDIDVDPEDTRTVLVATASGLTESRSGGTTFAPAPVQPPRTIVLVDHVFPLQGDREPSLVGLDAEGGVWERAADGWRSAGRLPGAPQAFTVLGPDRYVAANENGVFSSEDAGRSWKLIASARG